jgi:endonuclease/exonuclease/phosphatase family metal-dependent hydrolase
MILADSSNGGRELFILNTHWDQVSGAARQHGAKVIQTRIESLAKGLPVVVMGDMNDAEGSEPLKTLRGTEPKDLPLYDSFREVVPERGTDEASYHGFTGDTAGSRIDFILLSRDLKASDASIVHKEFGGRYPSDHFPVTAVLEVNERYIAWPADHSPSLSPCRSFGTKRPSLRTSSPSNQISPPP